MTDTTQATPTAAERIVAQATAARELARETTGYSGNDLAVAKAEALRLADAVIALAEALEQLPQSMAEIQADHFHQGITDLYFASNVWRVVHQARAALEAAAHALEEGR